MNDNPDPVTDHVAEAVATATEVLQKSPAANVPGGWPAVARDLTLKAPLTCLVAAFVLEAAIAWRRASVD